MHSTVRPHAHHNFIFQCSSLLPARQWQKKSCSRNHRPCQPLQAHRVEIEHASGVTTLEVEEGQTILETALDAGLELSHDCKMGVGSSNVLPCDERHCDSPLTHLHWLSQVCMTCPAKLVSALASLHQSLSREQLPLVSLKQNLSHSAGVW